MNKEVLLLGDLFTLIGVSNLSRCLHTIRLGIIGVLTLFLCFNLMAQTSSEVEALTPAETRGLIERTHQRLSNAVVSLSQRIDSILAADSIEDEKPDSSLKLRFSSALSEGEEAKYKMRIKTRIVLPRTQKRFQLVLQNLRDNLMEDGVPTAEEELAVGEPEATQTVRNEDFSTALRYVLRRKAHEYIHTDAGVRFRIPLDPFVRARSRQSLDLKAWELVFRQGAEWFKSSGSAFDLGMNWIRRLNRDLWFYQTNTARWTQELSQYDLQSGLSLVQMLPASRTLTYYFSLAGNSEPAVAVQSYTLGVNFRSPLFYEWLNLEISPLGSWARANQFQFQPGLVARLDAIIGNF